VAKYVASPQSIARVVSVLNKCPGPLPVRDRHGGPGEPCGVFRGLAAVEPIWRQVTPDASLKVRKGNYERIFNEDAGASCGNRRT
jgi:hypothetical protein